MGKPLLPDCILSLYHAFEGCINLKSICRFPTKVHDIDGCFKGCTSLEHLPEIPKSVESSRCAFEGCISLNEVVFAGCMPHPNLVCGISNGTVINELGNK